MTREEISNLIYEVTNEVLEKNQSVLDEGVFSATVETAVKLSCAANINLLKKTWSNR